MDVMKNIFSLAVVISLAASSIGCQTSYDAYGNPRNTVDPGTAAAGVAAAGLLGYAISKNRHDDGRHKYRHYNNRGGRYYHSSHRYSNRRGHYKYRGYH